MYCREKEGRVCMLRTNRLAYHLASKALITPFPCSISIISPQTTATGQDPLTTIRPASTQSKHARERDHALQPASLSLTRCTLSSARHERPIHGNAPCATPLPLLRILRSQFHVTCQAMTRIGWEQTAWNGIRSRRTNPALTGCTPTCNPRPPSPSLPPQVRAAEDC